MSSEGSKNHEKEYHPEEELNKLLHSLISPPTGCIRWRKSIYPDTYYTYIDNNTITITKNENGYYIIVNDMYFYIDNQHQEYYNAQHLFYNKIKSYFVDKTVELSKIITKIEQGSHFN